MMIIMISREKDPAQGQAATLGHLELCLHPPLFPHGIFVVAGPQEQRHVVVGQAALAHREEDAHDVADHLVQETGAMDDDAEAAVNLHDADVEHAPYRGCRDVIRP